MRLSDGLELASTTTTGGGGNAFPYQNGAYTLTNQSTIQGEGIIYNNGAVLNNQATINANSAGSPLINTLTLQYGTVNNTGLLEATNSGVLQLYQTTVNNAGGNITANGANATVQVYNATIQGGTLNTLAGGTLETIGTSVLDGSTGSGAINLSSGSTYTTPAAQVTEVLGTINNQGNFLVNGGGGSNTYIYTVGNTTLQGGGTVTLSTTGGGGNAFL